MSSPWIETISIAIGYHLLILCENFSLCLSLSQPKSNFIFLLHFYIQYYQLLYILKWNKTNTINGISLWYIKNNHSAEIDILSSCSYYNNSYKTTKSLSLSSIKSLINVYHKVTITSSVGLSFYLYLHSKNLSTSTLHIIVILQVN